jgi:hypothetical protein
LAPTLYAPGTKNGQAIGVVHVETKTLQRELAPAIKLANETACIALVRLGSSFCDEQLHVYEERLSTMESEPTNLLNFSEHLNKLNDHKDNLLLLNKQDVLIDDIYVELKKRAPKLITTDASVQHDELHLAQKKAESMLVTAINFVDEELENMDVQLTTSISDLELRCHEINESLSEEPYTNKDSDPQEVCLLLDQIGLQVEELSEQSTHFDQMKIMFQERREEQKNAKFRTIKKKDEENVKVEENENENEAAEPPVKSGPVLATYTTFQARKELWDMFHEWRKQWELWCSSDLRIFMNPEHEIPGKSLCRYAVVSENMYDDNIDTISHLPMYFLFSFLFSLCPTLSFSLFLFFSPSLLFSNRTMWQIIQQRIF